MRLTRLSKPLPSLHALRAFEAAARLGAFNKAADELNLSAASVSHHIRRLEAELGVALFVRTTRSVSLTRPGQALAASCHTAFTTISDSVDDIRQTQTTPSVTIALGSLLASRWLTPRLNKFWEQFPGVELSLVHRIGAVIPSTIPADITLSWGQFTEHDAEPLLSVSYVPVASPAYLQRKGKPATVSELLSHTLIQQTAATDWQCWLQTEQNGLNGVELLTIDDANIVIRSAIEGHGIALGCLPLINQDIADGKLQTVLNAVPNQTEGYQLRVSKKARQSVLITRIASWLLDEARQFESEGSYT